MRSFEFFFDYECPFCKIGYESYLELAGQYPDLHVIWRPCEAHPRPENDHPPHTDLCIQGYFLAESLGVDPVQYHTLMFRAVHVDHIDVEDPEALVRYAAGLIDPAVFREALAAGTYRDVQERANDYAYTENQVWFLPAFRMDGRALDAEGGVGVSREALDAFLKG